jgi:hypothetical protein
MDTKEVIMEYKKYFSDKENIFCSDILNKIERKIIKYNRKASQNDQLINEELIFYNDRDNLLITHKQLLVFGTFHTYCVNLDEIKTIIYSNDGNIQINDQKFKIDSIHSNIFLFANMIKEISKELQPEAYETRKRWELKYDTIKNNIDDKSKVTFFYVPEHEVNLFSLKMPGTCITCESEGTVHKTSLVHTESPTTFGLMKYDLTTKYILCDLCDKYFYNQKHIGIGIGILPDKAIELALKINNKKVFDAAIQLNDKYRVKRNIEKDRYWICGTCGNVNLIAGIIDLSKSCRKCNTIRPENEEYFVQDEKILVYSKIIETSDVIAELNVGEKFQIDSKIDFGRFYKIILSSGQTGYILKSSKIY